MALQAQAIEKSICIELSNPLKEQRTDVPICISLHELATGFPVRSATVTDNGKEIATQLDDMDGDLQADELAFVIDMPAGATKEIILSLSDQDNGKSYPARVFAQMLVRENKNNRHAPISAITVPGSVNFYNMLYGHGPMFESELVGYRIYFNQKQTVDPYGKFHKGLELKESRFYPTDEQLARGFGDDVLLVGNSCGIGALKGWDGKQATHIEPVVCRTERILSAGPIRTVVDVEVKGWEYQGRQQNMNCRYILYAGHRDLRVEISFDQPLQQETFCTGVQNIMGNETCSYSDHKGLVGSWGRHWPVNDTVKYAKETVGIATFIPRKFVRSEVSDKDNFLYLIANPNQQEFHYYTMFTSRKEEFGYPTPEAWFDYMRHWKTELEHPVTMRIRTRE